MTNNCGSLVHYGFVLCLNVYCTNHVFVGIAVSRERRSGSKNVASYPVLVLVSLAKYFSGPWFGSTTCEDPR